MLRFKFSFIYLIYLISVCVSQEFCPIVQDTHLRTSLAPSRSRALFSDVVTRGETGVERERGAGARDYTGTTHNTLSVNLRSSEVGDLRVESEDRELERGEPASLL